MKGDLMRGCLFLKSGHRQGLVPGIEHLVSFQEEAFDRIRMQDERVLVRQLDGESEDLAALSERQWLLEFKAMPSLPERPDRFVFPKPSIPSRTPSI